MSDPLTAAMSIAASGMKAQGARLRIVTENLANAQSTAEVPGGDPYRRKTISFKAELDRSRDLETVAVDRIGRDKADFRLVHNPGHPAANAEGYVKLPNVNSLMEMMDMREASRSYEANMAVLQQARTLTSRTIDLLKP